MSNSRYLLLKPFLIEWFDRQSPVKAFFILVELRAESDF